MMNSAFLLLILIGYLALLFFAAQWAERKGNSKWTNNPFVYTLSLAVYCTAWTYYGSIGTAAKNGLTYFPTYIGPVIVFPAWIYIMKKIIRISRVNKISSIADFISLRYGNSRALGAAITIITIVAILPYIALQLKAISETFHVLSHTGDTNVLFDTATYVALTLAVFAMFYGTRYVDATEKRKGIVTVVALESALKLFFYLILGVYVTFFVFDGFGDIYQKASKLEGFAEKNTISGLAGALNWYGYIMLALFAIFLLPRQFHMSVVENNRERHIRTAIWLFPLYMLLFNLFVFPIAWGGNILFEGQPGLNPDMYSLLIPQAFGKDFLALLVFLGGFSAAISMIVVSSITLSTMLSNNLLIPYGFIGSLQGDQARNNRRIIRSRRFGIFSLIILAYLSYRYLMANFSLVSVGMISFVFIAQLAPSFFGAIFWTRGSQKGAMSGLILGALVCTYTLLIPYITDVLVPGSGFVTNGPLGMELLKPFNLFGMPYLEPIPHALFWSLFFNTVVFAAVSVSHRGDYRERNYAEMYVNIDSYITNHENAFVWRGTAYISDIEKVLVRFLGQERTSRALRIFRMKYHIDPDDTMADARLIKFAEQLLTGHIGTASARILIQGVTKEDRISLPELLQILEESKENLITNKKLTETTRELRRLSGQLEQANTSLIIKDKQKDEFLDTVTHELRTPITAIRAASEILHDDDEMPEELRKQFLQNIMSESDRLNRLINKILDLEKLSSGRQQLNVMEGDIRELVRQSAEPLQQLMANSGIAFRMGEGPSVWTRFDRELLLQLMTNLLSNAIKFCDETSGRIGVSVTETSEKITISVYNNGPNVNPEESELIFDKFYQSQKQNRNKPVGSGIGLAISRRIAELHGGKLFPENHEPTGVTFIFELPQSGNL